ncbi:MAG: hypothetical protein ACOYJX_06130 [Acutalibacteraceae bacterium]|jgi:hypothetical protein
MSVAFNGLMANTATFCAGEGITAGIPVKVGANNTAAPCTAGDAFFGAAVSAGNGYAAVQLSGFVTLPYTGTAPVPGYNLLAGDGSGGVKVVTAGGRSLLVLNVDTSAKTAGLIL